MLDHRSLRKTTLCCLRLEKKRRHTNSTSDRIRQSRDSVAQNARASLGHASHALVLVVVHDDSCLWWYWWLDKLATSLVIFSTFCPFEPGYFLG